MLAYWRFEHFKKQTRQFLKYQLPILSSHNEARKKIPALPLL